MQNNAMLTMVLSKGDHLYLIECGHEEHGELMKVDALKEGIHKSS